MAKPNRPRATLKQTTLTILLGLFLLHTGPSLAKTAPVGGPVVFMLGLALIGIGLSRAP